MQAIAQDTAIEEAAGWVIDSVLLPERFGGNPPCTFGSRLIPLKPGNSAFSRDTSIFSPATPCGN